MGDGEGWFNDAQPLECDNKLGFMVREKLQLENLSKIHTDATSQEKGKKERIQKLSNQLMMWIADIGHWLMCIDTIW